MTKSILILVDFINDMLHEDGKLSHLFPDLSPGTLIENVNQLIAWAHQHHIPVVHVNSSFQESYMDFPKHSRAMKFIQEHNALIKNTFGTKLHAAVAYSSKQDSIITKHRISCFYGTELEQIMGTHQIHTMILAGLFTDQTIELTAREAHDRDISTVVVEDCSAGTQQAAHLIAVDKIHRYANVKQVNEITLLK